MSFLCDFLGVLPGDLNAIVEWAPEFAIVNLVVLLVAMMLIPAVVVRVVIEVVAVLKVRKKEIVKGTEWIRSGYEIVQNGKELRNEVNKNAK